jgi:hypothetical protein
MGFEHPGKSRRDGDDPAGILLAVVGLGALENCPLVGSPPDLEGLSVEVFGAEGSTSPSLMPVSVKVRTSAS